MKVLITILLSFISVISFAKPFDKIRLSGVSKSSNLEISYNSSNKKNVRAILSIVDEGDNVINSYIVVIKKGDNLISLKQGLNLPEGKYVVKINVQKKLLTTSFIIFERF